MGLSTCVFIPLDFKWLCSLFFAGLKIPRNLHIRCKWFAFVVKCIISIAIASAFLSFHHVNRPRFISILGLATLFPIKIQYNSTYLWFGFQIFSDYVYTSCDINQTEKTRKNNKRIHLMWCVIRIWMCFSFPFRLSDNIRCAVRGINWLSDNICSKVGN